MGQICKLCYCSFKWNLQVYCTGSGDFSPGHHCHACTWCLLLFLHASGNQYKQFIQACLLHRYVDTLQPMRYQAMDMMSRDQFYFCRQMPAPGGSCIHVKLADLQLSKNARSQLRRSQHPCTVLLDCIAASSHLPQAQAF